MHAFALLKALARKPTALFNSTPAAARNISIPSSRLHDLIAVHRGPGSALSATRSAHAPSAREESDIESDHMDQKQVDASEAGAESRHGYRDDMMDSFGAAYSTRSSDEGYGERRGEAYEFPTRDTPDQGDGASTQMQRGATAERDSQADANVSRGNYDRSQGGEVEEKEKGTA